MKKVLTLVVIIVFGLVTSATACFDRQDGPPSMRKRNTTTVLETKDPMLDTTSYSLSLVSEDGDLSVNVLTKYHKGKKVFFDCMRYLKSYGAYVAEADIKFDDKRGYTVSIRTSRDHYGAILTYEDDEADFIKKCLKYKKLQIRLTEYDGGFVGEITHTFNLSRFQEYYEHMTKLQKKVR